ncbi:MAG: glycosyltransferase family 2 protein [Myxococcales bacterium]|nr:glycosyltransferase family 2 protein [Myxococcales bacterium]
MSEPICPLRLAVVVATCNRPELLFERALASVRQQTRPPQRLVIVDDSDDRQRPVVRELVGRLHLEGCDITYLTNNRTPGASGSWNQALEYLLEVGEVPENTFVAILDDDDAWHPSYLERTLSAAHVHELDMVACGLRRIERQGVTASEPPASLDALDFLVGNPGIQGSNLFLRLFTILAAGGFDEGLSSTTDRDLCIRLADLGHVRYGTLPDALVDHFADADRPRLSAPGSTAKLAGLTGFWRKYSGRMTQRQRQAFVERAASLFRWVPPDDSPLTDHPGEPRKVAVVLGLTAGDDLTRTVTALARWKDTNLVGLDVVLLEPADAPESAAHEVASVLRDAGAGCFRFTADQQNTLAGGQPDSASTHGRLLHLYCAQVAAARTGTEVWLIDGPCMLSAAPTGVDPVEMLSWLGAERVEADPPAPAPTDTSLLRSLDDWIRAERIATAEHRVRRCFDTGQLRLLGSGSEAVVFTDGREVYKCIDYWKTRMPEQQLDFLRRQIGRWKDAPGLYPLREVIEDGPWVVLTYAYEASVPYEGGHEAGMVALLEGCRDVGVVCNNIHPKNLVVAASGVKLIDYGSDIRPWTPLGFEHMVRRAYLACRYPDAPALPSLMRRVLTDLALPEMAGYAAFRARVRQGTTLGRARAVPQSHLKPAPSHPPFPLHVGVITSDPLVLEPLLDSLVSVAESPCLTGLSVVVLDNGSPTGALEPVVQRARCAGLPVAVVDVARQDQDAAAGGFGALVPARLSGQVGIAMARTMLQRYLGAVMAADPGSIALVLDDDMRLDGRAQAYLPWLPAFRAHGVDVLLGAYEGASPNPPLNGLRVQLVDLLHNLKWLQSLPDQRRLPDRSRENAELRGRYPDYYYDLSRKHTGHLETPHWLEPAFCGETVREARSRLLANATGLLNGDPLTRPLVAAPVLDPLGTARDSVNRGGITFVLNPAALTQTPNTITWLDGREARRSDMVWAIVNRQYRGLTIKAVGFPVHHVGRVGGVPTLNAHKVRGEIVGSTLYAGLTAFLQQRPEHDLRFSHEDMERVCDLADRQLNQRWRALDWSFRRIAGLRASLRRLASGDLAELIGYLDRWFTPHRHAELRAGIRVHDRDQVHGFLSSLRTSADDYAHHTPLSIDFINTQLSRNPALEKISIGH